MSKGISKKSPKINLKGILKKSKCTIGLYRITMFEKITKDKGGFKSRRPQSFFSKIKTNVRFF